MPKHVMHICHLRRVPVPDVLIKRRSIPKHGTHVRHLRCVPVPNRRIETVSIRKCTLHVRHLANVPVRHRSKSTGDTIRGAQAIDGGGLALAETTGDRSRKRHVSEVYATTRKCIFHGYSDGYEC